MKHTFEQTYDGYTLTGHAEVEAAESATSIDPAYPAIVTVYELFINYSKENAIDIVSPALVHMLEQDIATEY